MNTHITHDLVALDQTLSRINGSRDLACAEETAKRKERMAEHITAQRLRLASLDCARQIYQKYPLWTSQEHLQALQNIGSAIRNDDGLRDRIAGLCADLEDEIAAQKMSRAEVFASMNVEE